MESVLSKRVNMFQFGFYEANFTVLIITILVLFYRQRQKNAKIEAEGAFSSTNIHGITAEVRAENYRFTKLYLIPYAIVMAGDWLQGAHIYALYKEQYGFHEEVVAFFFTAGFVSGALSAYFVGTLADRFGRRAMCCAFCITYSLSCLSTLFPVALYLFVGRALGGVSTSILYSAFESWMVSEFGKRGLAEKGASLSRLFGLVTSTNSLVAIASGVISEWLVTITGTRTAPFMASLVCLMIALVVMLSTWSENYGDEHKIDVKSPLAHPRPSALRTIFKDRRVLCLGLTSCIFEGSMYLFVFFWTPALRSTLPESQFKTRILPYGLIFAIFMSFMMLGSMLSTYVATTAKSLSTVLTIAAGTFFVNVVVHNEYIVFWMFCLFELCVGLYFPLIGQLKGQFIENDCRSGVYAMLRIPLNIFVVVTLALTREGDGHRDFVFACCSGLLLFSGFVLNRIA